MSKQRYEIRDTRGDTWVVMRGDPAHPLCDKLARAGWEAEGEVGILLPSSVLISGAVSPRDILAAREELEGVIPLVHELPGPESDKEVINVHATYQQLRALAAS